MTEAALVILVHQLLYQGTFFAKNFILKHKLGQPIRGHNLEATLSVGFFAGFIALSLWLAQSNSSWGKYPLLSDGLALASCLVLLAINLLLGLASLKDLGDSWRVGVIEGQQTALVETGIYRFSRNPYFVAYLLMFAAYTILLQNRVLMAMTLVGAVLIHLMILREERYLAALHPLDYSQYRRRVPRYML
jgi:protein-S-isoprenylcysteine O-methyltransferase Ste14